MWGRDRHRITGRGSESERGRGRSRGRARDRCAIKAEEEEGEVRQGRKEGGEKEEESTDIRPGVYQYYGRCPLSLN